MRILLVNDTLKNVGGAESYVRRLERELRANGEEVMSFSFEKGSGVFRHLLSLYNPLSRMKIAKAIQEFSPDIVHCNNIQHRLSPSILGPMKKKGIPVVMTVHDFQLICHKLYFMRSKGVPCEDGASLRCLVKKCPSSRNGPIWVPYHIFNLLRLAIHRKMIRRGVDTFICPSSCLADQIVDIMEGRRVRILPNFIDLPDCLMEGDRKGHRILYVGRLEGNKGVATLLGSMRRLLKDCPEAMLDIIGTGPLEQTLGCQIIDLGLSERVTLHGHLDYDELRSIYRRSGVLVIPSEGSENMPMVALEAMTNGLPVVASDIFGLKELAEKGQVTPFRCGDSEDLAKVLKDLISDNDRLKELSEAAIREVPSYGKETHLRLLRNIYSETMKGGK